MEPVNAYISDHVTGSSVVVQVVERRLARADEDWLDRLLVELRDERTVLRGLLARVGGAPPVGRAVGRAASVAGLAKLRIDGLRDDDLRDLIELELMLTGISGKLGLWRALHVLDTPGISEIDLDALEAQGERQRADVEEHRLAAAARLARG